MEKKELTIKVSLYEAALIEKLRKYSYGKFTVQKFDGEPKRVIAEESILLSAEDGIKITEEYTEANK